MESLGTQTLNPKPSTLNPPITGSTLLLGRSGLDLLEATCELEASTLRRSAYSRCRILGFKV